MKPFQKVIKYVAMAFAIYLAIMIISIIIFAITAIFGIGAGIENVNNNNISENTNTNQFINYTQEYTGIESLDIDLSKSKLEMRKGDSFKVEFVNVSKELSTKLENSGKELKIEDETLKLFENVNGESKVIIYIPSDYKLRDVKLDLIGVSGAYIEGLETEKLEVDMGSGKYEINNVQATIAEIDSGAGEVYINNSTFGDFELNAGVGKVTINCKVNNKGEIESGVGKLEVNLIGTKDNYRVRAETGIGNLTVDGNKVKNGEIVGNGSTNINVEAGIGETIINFVEEKI